MNIFNKNNLAIEMKTILFPTDFSTYAENAFYYAIGLAEKLNAKIILQHCCHLPVFTANIPPEEITEEKIFADASKRLKKYRIEKQVKSKNIPIEEYVSFGLAVDTIISVAEEKKVDLIVMGTKGSSGAEAVMIGSNASSVMGKTLCPLLVVPANASHSGLKKIIFTTDYHDNDVEAISRLAEIADLFNAEILIVHMCEPEHANALEEERFKKFREEVELKVRYDHLSFQFLMGVDLASVLNIVIEENQADVLSMSMRKKNIFSKLFEKNMTKSMVYHTHIPILSFHSR